MLDTVIGAVKGAVAGLLGRGDEPLAGVPEPESETVRLFLDGESVPMTSALTLPNIGGPELIEEQRRIEADIREYIGVLGETILDQQETIAQLQEEIDALQAELDALYQQAAGGSEDG